MIKAKTGEVFNSVRPLSVLAMLDLPVGAALKVAKCAREVNEAIKPIEDVKNKILIDGAKKDEKGKPLCENDDKGNPIEGKFVFENEEEISNQINELMDQDIDVNLNSKIKISSLGEVKTQGAVLANLFWLIEEE